MYWSGTLVKPNTTGVTASVITGLIINNDLIVHGDQEWCLTKISHLKTIKNVKVQELFKLELFLKIKSMQRGNIPCTVRANSLELLVPPLLVTVHV